MPKFLEVTDKAAAKQAISLRKFYVDDYGADPTGVASSNSAVTAALAALGNDPGVIVFGPGTYKLSTTVTLGPYQSVVGESRSSTVLNYSGTSAAIRVRDTRPFTGGGSDAASTNQLFTPGGVSGPGLGGRIADLTVRGTNAGANTCGLHIGDVLAPEISISVFDFDEAGSKGIWFDNRYTWCEYADVEARIANCKEAVVFSINGGAGQTSPPAGFPVDWYNGLKSFGYGRYDLYVIAFANQTAVRMTDAVLYNMAEFRLLGGFINNESPGGNTGKVLHLTGNAIFDSSPVIAVEAGGSGPRHQTIVREDNAAMYGRNAFLLFLNTFADGSGPWSTLVLSGYINVDNLIGKHGASQHAQRFLGSVTGSRGSLENGVWFFMSGNWFATTLSSGNTNFTVYDYPEPTPAGVQASSYDLFLRQPASGAAGTVTWPAGFVWAEGQAPTLSTTNNAVDWIHVETPDFVTFYATHVTGRNPRISKALGTLGNTVLNFVDASNGANYFNVYNGPSGGSPIIETAGPDANIHMYHGVKGTGRFYFNPGAGQGTCQFFTEGSATDINWDFYPQGSGRVRQAGVNIPTVSSSDTLTNKTLTSPRVNQINDTNGATSIALSGTASAINHLTIANAAAAGSPRIIAAGSDTNIALSLFSKGTGSHLFRHETGPTAFQVNPVASGVNQIAVTGTTTGNAPSVAATGTDTNINLNLISKGTGVVQANGATVATRLTGTATLDFGSVSAQSQADLTITVTGAATGDAVALGVPTAAVTAGIIYTAWVSATDTVTVRAANYTAGALDPASGTFRATIIR